MNKKHKIDTYFIPPKKHLDLGLKGNRLFALAHFVLQNDKEYISFFKNQDMFVTIDSGVAEGTRVPIATFMKCAERVNADEIIVVDELWDGQKTIELTKEFLAGLTKRQKQKYKFMMVPQGKTIEEYIKCLDYLQSLPECNCIGISKFDAPVIFGKKKDKHKVMQGRIRLVDYLAKHNLIRTPVHLLGYDNPKEFEHYIKKGYNFIRSCDSASAILCATEGIKFDLKNGIKTIKPAGGDRYHLLQLNDKDLELAERNMKVVKRFCNNID